MVSMRILVHGGIIARVIGKLLSKACMYSTNTFGCYARITGSQNENDLEWLFWPGMDSLKKKKTLP